MEKSVGHREREREREREEGGKEGKRERVGLSNILGGGSGGRVGEVSSNSHTK